MSAGATPREPADGTPAHAVAASVRQPESVESSAWRTAEEPSTDEPMEPAADEPSANASPDDTNVWPDAAAEAAFLAEAQARGEAASRPARAEDDEDEKASKQAPKLEELVEQIPAETRELMEDLFRARFVTVRRIRRADLKPQEQSR